jgi:predicted ATPase/DNA-binding CsgD family transcriptional regulator
VIALTLGQRRDNLPAEVTRFIGRRRELPAVADAIERYRLVTLRGAGGVGKTRLALRAAGAARESFADGCWLVELSALRNPELLPRTVSAALGLPDEAAGDPLAELAANLADREILLVLDTCEHLIEACARLARKLLKAAPGLRILATSREPLGVPDEQALLITPLELPDVPPSGEAPGGPAPVAPVAAVAASEAVALFVDRGRAALSGFDLTHENAGPVVQLCRRLDGIPLALELAAVRLRSMPVREILARLTDRFRILGTAHTNTGRHRTLRAAVLWSYELCTPAEQRLWAELSVFPGGFGLAAADHVCGPAATQMLTRLVEKSIVQYDEGTGRYQMLHTMREFGAERLAAADTGGSDGGGAHGGGTDGGAERAASADGVRARHRDYYLGLAGKAAAGSLSREQVDWLVRLGQETDNLRAALDYSFGAPAQQLAGLRMTVLLRTYWLMTGQFTEGRRWHDLAARVGAGSGDNAWAVYGAGLLAVQQGDLPTGTPQLARAAALAAAHGDEDLAAHVTDARGIVAFYSGDLETSRACHESALASYERIGFSDAVALSCYARLASACLLGFETGRAIELCEEYLRLCDMLGEQWGRGTALWVRGAGRWLSGDKAAATEDALACLRIKESLGDLRTIAMSFDLLSACLAAAGDVDRGAVLSGASDRLWKILNAPVPPGPAYAKIRSRAAGVARRQLGDERYETARQRGAALPLAAAIAVARGEGPAVANAADRAENKPLTRREREIAALVAEGLGNREIAQRLFLSKRTVDSHIEHIFAKLGFSSRMQLADWVREQAGQ